MYHAHKMEAVIFFICSIFIQKAKEAANPIFLSIILCSFIRIDGSNANAVHVFYSRS